MTSLKKQGKETLQTFDPKINHSVHDRKIGRDVNDQLRVVTDKWMKKNYVES